MSIAKAFTLRIYVVNGDPDGLRVVDRTNWNGKALVFPRTLLPTVKQRAEFTQTGVYMLVGPRTDAEGEMLYVGEGDPVRPSTAADVVLGGSVNGRKVWKDAAGHTLKELQEKQAKAN